MATEKESYEIRIKKLEKALKEARTERDKALARRDMLTQELKILNTRIQAMGCTPEELDDRIKEIRIEIEELMKKIETLLPRGYIERAGL